jgi:AraC-like DNA-binding protein
MLSVETAIRLIVIGQELLIAAVFLFSDSGRAARISGALLMFSVVGYLISSDDVLRNFVAHMSSIALLLSLLVPYCLWLFARAMFEAAWPRPWLMIASIVVVLVVWYSFKDGYAVSRFWTTSLSILMHVLSLAIVAHALWIALGGRPDDLVERRRSYRLVFVVVVSVQVASVLILELAYGAQIPPSWLQLVNVVSIAVITIGLALPLLDINAELFASAERLMAVGRGGGQQVQVVADELESKQLLELMSDGYYRQSGLTIRSLAEKLKLPEHRLRRLINGKLAYRNFSAFLNDFRIAEARERLTDPKNARAPVLTMALDLGYASLGPFNRAFRANTGRTPTDYRRQNIRPVLADSE